MQDIKKLQVAKAQVEDLIRIAKDLGDETSEQSARSVSRALSYALDDGSEDAQEFSAMLSDLEAVDKLAEALGVTI